MSKIDASLDLSNRRRSWRDLRATVRYRCAPATFGRVLLDDCSDDQEYQRAWLADLSAGGAGLMMIRPVAVGSSLHLVLRNPINHQLILLQAHVVHATQQVSGDWLVGCQFCRSLDREDLEELLG